MPFNDNKRRGAYVLSLEVVTGTNLVIPSGRTPAGHYVRIFTSHGQYNTAVKAAMADCSVSWNETLIIRGRQLMPPRLMPTFSSSSKKVRLEIRTSFEYGPMLGRGELVGTFETTLDHLLVHDGQFVMLSAVDDKSLSLKLKAQHMKTPQHAADGTMQIGRDTDAARDAYTLFRKSNRHIDLDTAISGFQSVLDRCPFGHPGHAAALSNLAHAILCGFTKNIRTDIDHAISLFRSALELRPREHPDHLLSSLDLCQALQQCYARIKRHADLREAAELYRSILPLCVEGSYLHRAVYDTNGVLYVIEQCNALPSGPSDEIIALRRIILELCPSQHRQRAYSLNKLAGDLYERFRQSGSFDSLVEAIHRSREALAARHADDDELSSLASVLSDTFWLYHGDPFELCKRIPLDICREEFDARSMASTQYSEWHHDQRSGSLSHAGNRPMMGWQSNGITGPDQGSQSLPPPPLPPPRRHPLTASSSNHQTRPLARNVVIFGDSGSGKSSVINAIAQTKLAETSSSATGCTFSYQRHKVEISGQKFVLFDTAGLNEGTAGTVPAAKAEGNLKSLLRELMNPGSDGISLLVYCVRSTRARRALIRNYNIFYSGICRKKVPVVVVVTGLENEPDMESWWDTNGKEFKSRGMHFEDHACVTTLRKHPGIPDIFSRRIEESSETLRNLILNNYSDWVVDKSWFKQSFAAVRNMISDSGNNERSLPSTLIICDPSRNEEVEIAPYMHGTLRTSSARICGETYQIHHVSAPEPHFPSSSTERRLEGDLLVYYARAEEFSAAREKFYAFYKAYRGNMVPVIVVVKGLNDGESAHQWVEQHIMQNGAGRIFSTFAPAGDIGDDSVRGQAGQELQDLIIRSCLVRNERKGRGRPKRFARRSRFLSGQVVLE